MRGIVIFVLAFSSVLSSVSGWGWGWNWCWDFDWSTQVPANCPHENPVTHVCSTLGSANATCYTIKCCSDFEDDEDYAEYDEDTSEKDENVYYLGRFSDYSCRLCYTVSQCSVYKCYRRCCDGYEADMYGRCREEGPKECQNGGTRRLDYDGRYSCVCPLNFGGESCEIPRCQCVNGGVCGVKDGQPHCNCTDGFQGEHCEKSACSLQCYNGGSCYKNGTNELCMCPDNFVGRQCERSFVQPENCPSTEYHAVCQTSCTGNDDCSGESVCCREGCSTVCREPKADYCVYEERPYRVGQAMQRSACVNCTCMSNGEWACFSMSCVQVMCADGRAAQTQPGQCCPACPDEPINKPPVIRCPNDVVTVYTSTGTDTARLDTQVKAVGAFDSQTGAALTVMYRPAYVPHPRHVSPGTTQTEVHAYSQDSRGNTASCTFRVSVLDKEIPRFTSCPEDIFVFEDEEVSWLEPTYQDNVGIAKKEVPNQLNGGVWPPGMHMVDYRIWDYDNNVARCSFDVSVTKRDSEQADVPLGLMDRSMDKKNSRLIIILAPIVGGLILIALVVAMLMCCRRQRHHSRHHRHHHHNHHRYQPPAYDNNIYVDADDVKVKLPPYSSPSYDPPAYSISGSMKDVTYTSLPPPSYTNPGYETLPADQKSETGSEKSSGSENGMAKSESVKSEI